MVRHRKHKVDPREQPSYSISEAAHYLNIPQATARYWATGQGIYPPLIMVAERQPAQLSFLNLVEMHILAAVDVQN